MAIIRMKYTLLDKIARYATGHLPEEACGLIAGSEDEYGRLIDTDLFRIIAELILMMQFFAIKSRMQFSDDDRVEITQTFVNRGLEKFSNVFYVTRYRRIGFELEPSIEKYLK